MEVVVWLIMYIAMAAASYAMQRHEAKKMSIKAGQINMPIAEQGVAFPVIFGTPPRIKTSLLICWGNGAIHKNHEHGVTYSVNYYFTAFLGLCRSGIDGIQQIWYADKNVAPFVGNLMVAYDGSATLQTGWQWTVNILGGDTAGGGIFGTFHIQYGAADQVPSESMTQLMGADIPAYRGIVTMTAVAYWGTSPIPREISYIAKATQLNCDGSERWYVAKADIETDGPYPDHEEVLAPTGVLYHHWHVLNPAHMLVQCLTDDTWGEGHSVDDLGDSFTDAADTLYDEGLGLGYAWWPDQVTLADLIQRIELHADGWLWQDHSTGKWEFALNRDDYTIGDLEIFDETDFVIEEMAPVVDAVVPNRILVTWTDRITGKRIPAVYDDTAAIQRTGKIIEIGFEREMICDAAVANFVAARLGRQVAAGLKTIKLTCKRTMSHLHRGSVVKLTYDMPDLAIAQMIVRVTKITHGRPGDDAVRIEAIEDMYAAGYTIYGDAPDSTWESPTHDPQDVTVYGLGEVPLWTLANDLYGRAAALALDADAGLLQAIAVGPTDDASSYDFTVSRAAGLAYQDLGDVPFTPWARLANALTQSTATEEIELTDDHGVAVISAGTYALIGAELVGVTAIDIGTGTITIQRGVLDTVPVAHPADARILFVEDRVGIDTYEYTAGDMPTVKFLTKTSAGTLDADDATARTAAAFASRATRPYPPGNFQLDDSAYPVSITGDVDLTWSHRDRTDASQLAAFVDQDDAADYGPEAGTTYTVRVYDQSNGLIRTAAGISGKTYTYTEAFERSDCGLGANDPLNTQLRFTVVAVRGGYESFQGQDVTVSRAQSFAALLAYANQLLAWEDELLCYQYTPANDLYFYDDEPLCYANGLFAEASEWGNILCYENEPLFYENELIEI